MDLAIGLLIGAAVATLIVLVVRRGGGTTVDTTAVDTAVQSALAEAMRQLDERARLDRAETIRLATEQITAASGNELGAKAQVIDATMKGIHQAVTTKMQEIDQALRSLSETTAHQYGTIEKAVTTLSVRTDNLREVLSSSQARGQWGERLAEDMLRAAGFVEGINYQKQVIIDGGGKPDYRFDLPNERVLFMDVKFPLDRYAEHVGAPTEEVRKIARDAFVKAVRSHVEALAKRDYIDKSAENTIDYVLMFVPNESISSFVHEADPALIDWALQKKVVLCSPLTLYAFLVVIRQATDSFHTERTAAEIMQHINLFQKEWGNYTATLTKVRKSFDALTDQLGQLEPGGTRHNQLNRQVKKIEQLRTKQGVPELAAPSDSDIDVDDDGIDLELEQPGV